MPKKKRKSKEPFWKKGGPELKSIAGHIGKFVDNLKANDVLDLLAAGICSWCGYQAGKQLGADQMESLGMAASGLVSYQIAKAPNQIASACAAAYLASIGVIAAWNPLTQGIEEAAKNIFPFYSEERHSPITSTGVTGTRISIGFLKGLG